MSSGLSLPNIAKMLSKFCARLGQWIEFDPSSLRGVSAGGELSLPFPSLLYKACNRLVTPSSRVLT